MTSRELNAAMCKFDNPLNHQEIVVRGLEGTGKIIPYIGWYWRDVDFDAKSHQFGIIGDLPLTSQILELEEVKFTGFMENNKWGYDLTRETTVEEWHLIKLALEVAVRYPRSETFQAVFDMIQGMA